MVGGLGALSACSGGPAPAPSPPPSSGALPTGLEVSLEQYRSDRAGRVLQLKVENGSDADVRVTGATFSSPAFTEDAVWPKDGTTILAGRTRDLPVDLADPVCTGVVAAGASLPSASVTLALRLPDGSSGTVRLVPADPFDSLSTIHTEDCAAADIAAVAAIVGSSVRVEGSGDISVAVLNVTATPRGGTGSVLLESVGTTVLLEADGGGAWPLETPISGSGPATGLELRIVPNRCDPHAVAEDKVGTRLPVTALDASGVRRTFALPLAEGVKSQLLSFVAAHCGYGG